MKGSRTLLAILCGVALLGWSAHGHGSTYTFDMGPNSSVNTSGTNAMLQMEAKVNPGLDSLTFPLAPGESRSFYFATLYTKEDWINADDKVPGSITAYVDFDNPDLVQAIGGTSIGFSAHWDFTQGWNLRWQDPVAVSFGQGGQFTIELEDVSYTSWFWQGPDGCGAKVDATVTLDAAPVPLPGSLVLMGAGLAFMGGWRFRRLKKH